MQISDSHGSDGVPRNRIPELELVGAVTGRRAVIPGRTGCYEGTLSLAGWPAAGPGSPQFMVPRGMPMESYSMKLRSPGLWLACVCVCLALLCSCGRQEKGASISSAPPEVGVVYSLSDGEGGFRAAKVLAVEGEIVFVNLYTERWPARPSLDAAKKASTPSGLAYSVQSFAGMQPVRLEAGNVSPEELQAFEEWKQSKRD